MLIAGCGKNFSSSMELASQKVTDSLGCKNMKSRVFDAFYENLYQNQSIPQPRFMKQALNRQFVAIKKNKALNEQDAAKINEIEKSLFLVTDLMLSESSTNHEISVTEQFKF